MVQHEIDQANPEIPIACTLTAEEQAAWSAGIGRTVFGGYQERRELSDGYAFRFPGDTHWAQTLSDFVMHERECCPFFTFALVFAPAQGPIWLHLTGSAEIKAFVEGMMHAPDRLP